MQSCFQWIASKYVYNPPFYSQSRGENFKKKFWQTSLTNFLPFFWMVSAAQTRMQVFATSPAAVYTGIGNAFTRISSTEGVRALWRGVSSVIMGAGPAHAVHFGAYEAVKDLVGGNVEGSRNQWLATCEFSPVCTLQEKSCICFFFHCEARGFRVG